MTQPTIVHSKNAHGILSSLTQFSKKITKPIVVSATLAFLPTAAIAGIDSIDVKAADTSSYTQKVDNSYHPKKQMLAYIGDINELLSAVNIYDHKMIVYTTNPFDGQQNEIMINPDSVSKHHVDTLGESDKLTAGSYFHEKDPALPAHIFIHNTQEIQINKDMEVSENVLLDLYKGIIPKEIATSKRDVNQALAQIYAVDFQYTVFHEMAHTLLSSLNEVDIHNMSELDSHLNNKEMYLEDYDVLDHQIKESVADMSSIIYMQKNGYLDGGQLRLAIKGLILRRLENTVWFEEVDEYTRFAGDVGHNTVPALMALLEIYNNDPAAFSEITTEQIITVSENIVWELISQGNPFLDKAELIDNIANDQTITRLKKESSTASTKSEDPEYDIDNHKVISETARNHEKQYLIDYYHSTLAVAKSAMEGFNISSATKNTGTKYHTLRDMDGEIINKDKQTSVIEEYRYKKMVSRTGGDPAGKFTDEEIEVMVLSYVSNNDARQEPIQGKSKAIRVVASNIQRP